MDLDDYENAPVGTMRQAWTFLKIIALRTNHQMLTICKAKLLNVT